MDNRQQGIPPTPYKFSNDEMRALQECNSESFFQRSLPCSTIFGVGTYLGVKNGYLGGNSKYGSVPKVVAAVIAGYIIGKISYQGKCVEKIMALPDSKLGDMLRERKKTGRYTDTLTMDQPDLSKMFGEVPQSETYTDFPKRTSHMDFDTERHDSNLDDSSRPNFDDVRTEDESLLLGPPATSHTTSYDELRRQNRESYDAKMNKSYQRSSIRPDEVPSALETRDHRQESVKREEPSQWPKATNKYGDSWEK